MKTIFLDIMLNGKFFRQVKYQYSPIFKFNIEDMANYVLEKYPSLKKEKHVEIAVGGNRVS